MENHSIKIEFFTRIAKKKGVMTYRGKRKRKTFTVDLDKRLIKYDGQLFHLERIAGTYGGHRYFFVCPKCLKRCRVLYQPSHALWACGTCHQVHNRTLNRTKTDPTYFWELALKECRKVDPSYFPKRIFNDFPKRPKGMRQKTYQKHYERYLKYLEKGKSVRLKG